MTPQQLRLLFPLRPQTATETARNLVSLAFTIWPLSAIHAAWTGYCETFSAALDPMPRDVFLWPDR